MCHAGYTRDGSVPRCEGEDHAIRWFNVYGPKIFACIGGVSGALLSRCIIIHMTPAPPDSVRKSTRQRALDRDAAPLREMLEAYALQSAEALTKLYEEEPDAGYWPDVTDREAEIWSPLLYAARLASPDLEADLLDAYALLTRAKKEIEAGDWATARTMALYDAVSQLREGVERFSPADLLTALNESEAWASTFSRCGKGEDKNKARAARVGNFLRTFRLKVQHSHSGSSYSRSEALQALRAHIPNLPTPVAAATADEVVPVPVPVATPQIFPPPPYPPPDAEKVSD